MKKRIFKLAVIALLTIASTIILSGCTQDPNLYKVNRVVDGDTIEVLDNGKTEKIRLIGVNTPETKHPTKGVEPYGKQASAFTTNQLEGENVKLEFDVEKRDKYGRMLAYVWLGDKMFNAVLVEQGYAQVATYPPNVKYVDLFVQLQKEARDNKRGLWGDIVTDPLTTKPLTTDHVIDAAYVGSLKSKKYHMSSCQWAKKISSKNLIRFSNKGDAQAQGYSPCSVCNP